MPKVATPVEEVLEIRENADGSATIGDDDDELLDGADAGNGAGTQSTEHDDDDDDDLGTGEERTTQVAGDADSEGGETDGDDREGIRARRRQERADKRARVKERRESEERERNELRLANQQLTERLNQVERRTTGAEIAQLDAAIAEADNALKYYEQVLGNAITKQDGAAAIEATRRADAARTRLTQFNNIKTNLARTTQATTAPTAPDPRIVAAAQQWIGKNSWYVPNGTDVDSRIAHALDQDVQASGKNPASPEYWEELDRRVAKYLPHRAKSGSTLSAPTATRRSARATVSGSGREGAAQGGSRSSFTLSADRVQALKDAGMWEDPKARSEAIKSYRDYDRTHSGKKS